MNTQAHVLLAAALFAKPDKPVRNTALVVGALIPDITIFWMVFWERFVRGLSFQQIFDESYFSDFWQSIFTVPNSIPLYAVIIVVGLAARFEALWVFAAAALAHVVLDFPLHHDDGRPHFWPFSDWVFESPVSYWDPQHYGGIAGLVELALCIGCAVWLWRRFHGVFARSAVAVILALEAVFVLGGFFFL